MANLKQMEMFSKTEMGKKPKPFDGNELVQKQYVDESEKRQYELLLPEKEIRRKSKRGSRI